MTRLFDFLASLRLAVILLVLLLVGLAAGTIIESRAGVDVAGRTVYYAWWFLGLQGLFALNLAMSLADLAPWGKKRVGFVMIHGSLLLILAGATLTYVFKKEGTLTLWEGQSAAVMVDMDREGHVKAQHPLPFSVKLEDFVLDTYPGTMRPAGFASQVQITDTETQRTFPARIWMNHELKHRGYALFQSSYMQENGREGTVLSIAKDPGQLPVFLGYALLVAGMIVVLGTRIAASKATPLAALLLLAGSALSAQNFTESLRRLPVQHDGRTMPMDTLARETVSTVTGQRRWKGEDPVATFSRWIADPETTSQEVVVRLPSKDFAVAAGFPGVTHVSFMQVLQSPKTLQLVREFHLAAQQERPRTGLLKDAEKLDKQMMTMQGVLQQEILRVVPHSAQSSARWTAPPTFVPEALSRLAQGQRLVGWPEPAQLEKEILYNKANPERLSWIVLAVSLVLAIVGWVRGIKLLDHLSFGALVLGFGVMTWGIGLRWIAGGRVPAANMYESMLFLGWGVGLFAVVANLFIRNRIVVVNAAAMAALTMALTDLLPIDRFIHPIAPVLSGTPWLAIHVPIIMVGYAVLALGMVVSHMQIATMAFSPLKKELAQRFHELNYWYIHVGSILLLAGILTGSVWAASSWGRYWGWDPKEVWSLVAFLAYMAILHARLDHLIGRFWMAVISVVSFQTILMTYLGVNFVLGSGMHAYGAGDSPVLKWMVLVAVVELTFLLWAVLVHRQQKA